MLLILNVPQANDCEGDLREPVDFDARSETDSGHRRASQEGGLQVHRRQDPHQEHDHRSKRGDHPEGADGQERESQEGRRKRPG